MNPETPPLVAALAPKSDQLNAEDLLAGPRVVTVKSVKVNPDAEQQPITIYLEGGLRPYKPCKTMGRVLLTAWGLDGNWVGRSMRLYRDPSVTFGKDTPGGIRISHLSHISRPLVEQFTVSRGSRKPIRIEPLAASDIPPTDILNQARALAREALGRGWKKADIEAAMKGKKIEDMNPEEIGTFMRDLMHAPPVVEQREPGSEG